MKAKTSLTLSEDLLKDLDRMAGPNVSRSSFIERILRDFVEQPNLELVIPELS
jgi:metal-responsive CopG/Arc/MetJ family transcriptional regulator